MIEPTNIVVNAPKVAAGDGGRTTTIDDAFDIREKRENKGTKGKSCKEGMGNKARRRGRPSKHGLSGTPTYKSWESARQRCRNPNSPHYGNYGGRGIHCELNVEQIAAEIGLRPSGKSLDRIDPNGNYEPGNIKWATRQEQARNRNSNHRVEYNGRNLSIAEWSEQTGIPETTIASRLQRGWPPRRALTKPVCKKTSKEYRRQAVELKNWRCERNAFVRIHRDMVFAWHRHVAECGTSPLVINKSWLQEQYEHFNRSDEDKGCLTRLSELGFPPAPMTQAERDEAWDAIEQGHENAGEPSLKCHECHAVHEASRSRLALEILDTYFRSNPFPEFHDYISFLDLLLINLCQFRVDDGHPVDQKSLVQHQRAFQRERTSRKELEASCSQFVLKRIKENRPELFERPHEHQMAFMNAIFDLLPVALKSRSLGGKQPDDIGASSVKAIINNPLNNKGLIRFSLQKL